MEMRVMPLEDMFNGNNQQMARFDDLWYLFRNSDVVHCPVASAAKEAGLFTDSLSKKGRYQTSFLVYYKGLHSVDEPNPDDIRANDQRIVLWCYYLDHEGETYGPVSETSFIDRFVGRQSIHDLKVYPLRFAVDAERLQSELRTQGARFRDLVKLKHVFCEGWTLTGQPLGTLEGNGEEATEHVESDVIIDVAEAVRGIPSWKPEFDTSSFAEALAAWRYRDDPMTILHWPSREQITQQTRPWLKTDGTKSNKFVKAFGDGVVKTLDGLDEDTNNLLLPRRLFVYVLRKRRFAMVHTMSLRSVPPQSTIFDDLRIDSNHKLIVQSLVADHFEKRRVQREWPVFSAMNQDIVRGKGPGLFMLLHGVSGVGKTATAEAVAQTNNKPLFTITCGDLGLTPEAVDTKLNEVFRHTGRSFQVSDTHQPVLRAAFSTSDDRDLPHQHQKLRAIEDEKQHQLQETGIEHPRLRIKAKRIIEYAQRYFDEHAETPHLRWNGRQIRNAFQIASSLSHYNIRKSSFSDPNVASAQTQCPVLDDVQFDKVAEAIERFGNYMDHTKAMTDADHARLEAIRANEIRNEDLTPRRRGYTSFGAPIAPASPYDRRSTTSSYQMRKMPNPGQAPSQYSPPDPASNTKYEGRVKRDAQEQSERGVREEDRAAGCEHAPLSRPTYEEGYEKGYEEEMDVPGAITRTYGEQQEEPLEEDGDDVDDFDDFDDFYEEAARNSQAAEYEGKDDDYDD
ncbi:hypothetical protein CSAL01_04354 [Colletotrichum salicis]|uniref:Uncharacterized protein n=1 Tax=Colletotrichum salicis TaxID=1209931 RepID=A0A135UGU3_9PEZI|nr:hypothetical protein CSAL01_04354 [Colletotrichum salicis]